jgi:hypothetical protein
LINCADFMAELGNYLEDDVAAELRARLEAHLAHCQTCHVVVDSARKTLRVITDSGSFDLPEAAAAPIAETIMRRLKGGMARS